MNSIEEVIRNYDRLHGSVIKIVLGDTIVTIGRELMYVPSAGIESVHEESNDNGQKIILFATSRSLVISSTTFPHKNIHKYSWKSPDGRNMKQIDHL